MGAIFTKENLKTAGMVTLGVLLAQRFAPATSPLIKGAAAFGGGLAGLLLSKKF